MKRVVVFLVLCLVGYSQVKAFDDVDESHVYYESIKYFADQNILSDNDLFRPDEKINRVECLKIVLLGSNIDIAPVLTDNIGFSDIDIYAWYAKYINKAKLLGIVKGNKNGTFTPDRRVNLAEALKMVVNTNEFPIVYTIKNDPYIGVDKNAWFSPYFDYAKKYSLLGGSKKVDPGKEITRAELVNLMYISKKHKDTLNQKQYASYYAGRFTKTSNGDDFDQDGLTAAHRILPFGTKVRVTNTDNGKEVVVKINDRGPFIEGRIIDLSKGAFEMIAPLSRGVVPVSIEPLIDEGVKQRSVLNPDFFDGITLENGIPLTYAVNEVYLVKGSADSDSVSVFLVSGEGQKKVFRGQVNKGKFEVPVLLPKEGEYKLGIILGEKGEGKVCDISVVPNNNITKNGEKVSIETAVGVIDNKTYIRWETDKRLTFISFVQADKELNFILNNYQDSFEVPYESFSEFIEGEVEIYIGFADSDSVFSFDRSSPWYVLDPIKISVCEHRPSFNDDLKISKKDKVYVIYPDLSIGIAKLGDVDFNDEGVYIVSKYNKEGQLEQLYPVYNTFKIPLLPNPLDYEIIEMAFDTNVMEQKMLYLINKERRSLGLKEFIRDPDLDIIARTKNEHMKDNIYFGHVYNGIAIDDLKGDYKGNIYENLAKDYNTLMAHYGLMVSAAHRLNIINEDLNKIGLSITKNDDGSYTFVQIFCS